MFMEFWMLEWTPEKDRLFNRLFWTVQFAIAATTVFLSRYASMWGAVGIYALMAVMIDLALFVRTEGHYVQLCWDYWEEIHDPKMKYKRTADLRWILMALQTALGIAILIGGVVYAFTVGRYANMTLTAEIGPEMSKELLLGLVSAIMLPIITVWRVGHCCNRYVALRGRLRGIWATPDDVAISER